MKILLTSQEEVPSIAQALDLTLSGIPFAREPVLSKTVSG
jgi:hypothetical protein